MFLEEYHVVEIETNIGFIPRSILVTTISLVWIRTSNRSSTIETIALFPITRILSIL